jgi:hypothetical protein
MQTLKIKYEDNFGNPQVIIFNSLFSKYTPKDITDEFLLDIDAVMRELAEDQEDVIYLEQQDFEKRFVVFTQLLAQSGDQLKGVAEKVLDDTKVAEEFEARTTKVNGKYRLKTDTAKLTLNIQNAALTGVIAILVSIPLIVGYFINNYHMPLQILFGTFAAICIYNLIRATTRSRKAKRNDV